MQDKDDGNIDSGSSGSEAEEHRSSEQSKQLNEEEEGIELLQIPEEEVETSTSDAPAPASSAACQPEVPPEATDVDMEAKQPEDPCTEAASKESRKALV